MDLCFQQYLTLASWQNVSNVGYEIILEKNFKKHFCATCISNQNTQSITRMLPWAKSSGKKKTYITISARAGAIRIIRDRIESIFFKGFKGTIEWKKIIKTSSLKFYQVELLIIKNIKWK